VTSIKDVERLYLIWAGLVEYELPDVSKYRMKVAVIGPANIDDQHYVNKIIKDSGWGIDLLIDPMHDGVSFRALVWAIHSGINILHVPAYDKDADKQADTICKLADGLIAIVDSRSRKAMTIYNKFKETNKLIYETKRPSK
jgi:hypothetical protein